MQAMSGTRSFIFLNLHKISCLRSATLLTPPPASYVITGAAAKSYKSTLAPTCVNRIDFQSHLHKGHFPKLSKTSLQTVNSSSKQILRMIVSTPPSNTNVKVDPTKPKEETITKPSVDGKVESSPSTLPQGELSTKEKLKRAVRDYGATVIVFHVTMSLTSLGFFYLLVSSGLDVVALLAKIGVSESILQSKATEEASKFVLAYAVHKIFAPARVFITLTATPLIVRKLRSIGILKQAVKPKST